MITENINIITQEAITRPLIWPVLVIGVIGILFALSIIIVLIIRPKDWYERTKRLFYHAYACIPLMIVTEIICAIYFPVATGRYKYTGILDDDMTIVEYVEFQEAYANIKYEDGLWYWEDK